ncbi:MAG: ABC transporter permease [Chloroflexi bacterium]|nr:ABC transporter permease [Chloroflexota bacterium]
MRNFWLIAKHEYRGTVFKRAFILLTLAIPLGMAAVIALAIFVATSGENTLPVGYVDKADILDVNRQSLASMPTGIEVRAFPDEEAALATLEREEIQAFFVFPSDYPSTLQTDLYYLEEPPSNDVWRDFDNFVRANLVATYPDEVRTRLLEGPNITVHDIVSNREFSESSIINVILPFVATFFFFIATMSASGYMLQVVATEKENRTMEIMITSVTPGQLIGGKAAGLLAAALTQLAIYVIAAVVGLIVAAPHVEELQQVTVPWAYLGVMALFFFPAYALIAAVMVAIGAAVTKVQEGQQVAGILNLFFMAPLFLMIVIFENPAAPLVVFFTLFPTTAFMTISLRWGLGTVPLWQIGVSWISLVATTVFMVWAAARVFRAGMLRYGQPLNLKAAMAVIRGN